MLKKAGSTMKEFNSFGRIVKYDSETGVLSVAIAEERLDKHSETMDYEASKPFFKEWSEEFEKATEGASFGNLRAMHNRDVAGKFVKVYFDDTEKVVYGDIEVVHPIHKALLDKNCYTGVSIGGVKVKPSDDVLAKWSQLPDGKTRYIARPREVSLVDSPAMYGARFIRKSADGEQEVEVIGGAEQALNEIIKWANNIEPKVEKLEEEEIDMKPEEMSELFKSELKSSHETLEKAFDAKVTALTETLTKSFDEKVADIKKELDLTKQAISEVIGAPAKAVVKEDDSQNTGDVEKKETPKQVQKISTQEEAIEFLAGGF
jgi:hypothetical protein